MKKTDKKIIAFAIFVAFLGLIIGSSFLIANATSYNEIEDFVNSVEIKSPVSYKNLTIFPVIAQSAFQARLKEVWPNKNLTIVPVITQSRRLNIRPITTDEALKKDYLIITESKGGTVPFVEITNKSNNWVFIMSGEIVTGGKQDRMIKEDVLIPPKSEAIKIAVYCVEHGRWTYKTKRFGSLEANTNISVRQIARQSEAQSEVWNSIKRFQAKNKVVSDTGALRDVYECEKVMAKTESYTKRFENIPNLNSEVTGVVVAIKGKIMCADIFSDSALFNKLWPKLLKSYVVEATSADGNDSKKVDKNDVKLFLARAVDASQQREDTPGEGKIIKMKSSKVNGCALVYNANVIHFDLFPYEEISYRPDRPEPEIQIAPPNIRQQIR